VSDGRVSDFNPRAAHIVRPYDGEYPWDLLLEADPSRSRVEGYVSDALTRIAKVDEETVAVYALVRNTSTCFELMNIAVRDDYRGCGLGRRMMGHALGLAESKGARIVEVGSANSSLDNLAFYQRNGFRIVGVDPDFFTQHYAEPIYENGIQARDRVRLRLELTPE
jgi:ribosomal protein S18 acetylase RimI-like enzyme